ncbi:MBL fold metallo-hydrolase [candidate division KSB1 bacterium]|nr:MBL fold metallo-hydrolase [candidate division KSB1 bacterium]NIR69737.1 MBL fold metallo-hydrolase [candidate division KSB1 bacterium]NIS22925.1 MBL fold metallo-hydrolase [candidate division KSB1 bacterium]NIT69782.1 MBL fold metallo-hydrolase [candidate division KSB1 bacterium]NIU23456.1 MBL fold metallo-hydrolase [candidate division KSB1 bacterium]
MIETTQIGPVTQYKLNRRLFGKRIYSTAAYYVDGLLIDTGFHHIANDFFRLLRQHKVEQIVHTHAHEDHVAANFLFQKHLGIIGKVHSIGIDLIANPPKKLKPYRSLVWGHPRPAKILPIDDIIETDHYTFKVIELPGHSKDHIGFYEPNEGWLFGGDLFLSVKVKVLKYDEDYLDWKRSLKQALTLPASTYLCGSSKILQNPDKYLNLKLEFFEETENKILNLHRNGWPHKKIRNKVLGRESTLTYISQGEFSKLNLVKSILGDN